MGRPGQSKLALVLFAALLVGFDKPKPTTSKEPEVEAPTPPPATPTVAEPATGIDVVEKDKCVAHWSDGASAPVDCPIELAGADVGSNMAKESGDCFVHRAEAGARKNAKCPEVMTKKATPGQLPPRSSGRSRSCGTCAIGARDDAHDAGDAREDVYAVVLAAGMVLLVRGRATSRRRR